MGSIQNLLNTQAMLESRFSDFLASLDKSRTTTLRQLLITQGALSRLDAPWLNVDLFEVRLRAAQSYLESVPPHSDVRRHTPFVFFQSSPEDEDTEYFERIFNRVLREDAYVSPGLRMRKKFGPAIDYLHTDTDWSDRLEGSWEKHDRIIVPLSPFSNRDDAGVFQERRKPGIKSMSVMGYRVPDYPRLLGVHADIATEYFARYVIHDIGHGWLPHIGPTEEMLHNGVMILAAKAGPKKCATAWEQVVYDECTDPYFMSDAPERLREVDTSRISPTSQYLLGKLGDLYAGHERSAHLQLWDTAEGMDVQLMRRCMQHVYADLPRTGFGRYSKKRAG